MDNLSTEGFQFDLPKGTSSIIKVIGVGGGGNNALRHMYERGIHGVDFIICNTDSQTLDNNPVATKVQLGTSLTEGLGAGADPEVGEKAAIESIDDIKASLGQGTKMIFITAGMGGGTGTGAAPVIAKVAKEMGILTVAIVTIPFTFEGKRRLAQAEEGMEKLRNNVDSLIVINNDKLRQLFGNLGFKSGFAKADEILTNAAKGMAEVITGYFDVNIDFRDAKSVLQNSGTALMSTGIAEGEGKAEKAVRKALDSPLLNDNKITGAKNVLLLIRSGSEEVTMDEIGVIMDHIQTEAGNTADIIFGVGSDEELGEAVSVLVIATGFEKENQKYAGPTERVVHRLTEEKSTSNVVAFQSETEKQTPPASGRLFRLDDDEPEIKPDFPVNSAIKENAKQFAKREVAEVGRFEYDEDVEHNSEAERLDLFEAEHEETHEETEMEENVFSFSFDTETPESPQYLEEDIAEAPKDFPIEEEPTATHEQVASAEEENEEEIHIVDKTPKDDTHRRANERRDKLKAFNSRFKSAEAEIDFENVPAFKRKNITLNTDKASNRTINSFLSADDNQARLKENRFLNKDVD